jgi:hypothetical protein
MKTTAGFGVFRTTQISNEDGTRRLRIDRADQHVIIDAAVIEAALFGMTKWTSMSGDVLRVEAENRTVCYRVGEYQPERHGHVAERIDYRTRTGIMAE